MDSAIDALFLEALQIPAGTERDAFLDEACKDDAEMRRRLNAMLADDTAADAFFDGPDTVSTPFIRPSAPVEKPGDIIGRYKLLQEIGEGGFGIVYLADQLEPVKRRVALKVLKPGMDTREVVARFEAERQSLALMDHPNIARIFDGGATDSGRPYFVMELVNGIPLTKYCDDHQLTTRQRLDLFLDVLAAVQHAHQKGVIHRDLKPSNILVSSSVDFQSTPSGQSGLEVHATIGAANARPVVKVIDFGIAKAISLELTEKSVFTAHGHMIGTPQYMSPEQAEVNALDVDTRSDLYSLGVVLYELLTGRTPIDPKRLRAVAYAEIQRLIREELPPKPSTRITTLGDALADVARQRGAEPEKLGKQVRGDLDWIVMKCLEKDRSRRYETANGFAADLRRHLENQPVVARPPGTAYLFSRFVRRHKIGFAAGAAVALSLVAGIAAAIWGMVRAETETTKAVAANEENKQHRHRASMADFTSAVKALEAELTATRKGEPAAGFAGKSRWHEGVVLLTRSLERDLENTAAALSLYETLHNRQAEYSDWPLLLLKHTAPVQSASFSPDGVRIVTTSKDNTARVWDAVTGQPIGEPMSHANSVNSAMFSPDGTRVVTSSDDNTARVWDAATCQAIGEPMRHGERVKSATFSPDGTRVVTASGDNTAQVWNAVNGHAIGQPMRHETEVNCASFSPDGTKVVTASDVQIAGIWDAVTGHAFGEPIAPAYARVWDAVTGHAIGQPIRHEAKVLSASFSPDGTRIVTSTEDYTARVWDWANSQAIGNPMRHLAQVLRLSFSPDGTRVVTASSDKTARVWDAATGQAIGQPMRHDGDVNSAIFSPDCTRIVTASSDKTARVWDAATGQAIGQPMRHDGDVNSAIFSPDCTRIVTASIDRTARVWDAVTGQIIGHPMRLGHRVTSAGFSPDGTRIITSSSDDTARVWDSVTGDALGGPMRPVGIESFSPDGVRIVTTSNDNTAQVWNVVDGQAVGQPMRHEAPVLSASFSPDGTRVVTRSADYTVRVWNAVTGQAVGQPMRHAYSLESASFSPDGTKLVTADIDGTAQVWDAMTGQAIGQPMRHKARVLSATFSPNGAWVVTGSNDRTARIWNAVTGQPIGQPLRHEAEVDCASFSPDGTKIITSSKDDTARVWDLAASKVIGQPMHHESLNSSATFSPDGTKVVTSSYEPSSSRRWDERWVASERWVARAWDSVTGDALGEIIRLTPPLPIVLSVSFSSDGTRVLTRGDNAALMWRILPMEESAAIPTITPEILAWARNFAGLRFSEDGELHLIPDEERLAAISTLALPAGPWTDLARWINTAAPQRTIDLKSKFTPRQIAVRERDYIGNGTVESLESAVRNDPTVPLARLFLAAALEKADATKEAKDRESSVTQRAAFLRRYDLDALAREAGRMKNDELAALWVRAANHLLGLPPETKTGVGPKPTTAREEAEKAARKALELVPDLPAAEEVLKKF